MEPEPIWIRDLVAVLVVDAGIGLDILDIPMSLFSAIVQRVHEKNGGAPANESDIDRHERIRAIARASRGN